MVLVHLAIDLMIFLFDCRSDFSELIDKKYGDYLVNLITTNVGPPFMDPSTMTGDASSHHMVDSSEYLGGFGL